MLLSVVAPAQDVPIFQVDKCSCESSIFNGDVAEVTGRAVNPVKAHWQSARFKALVRMVSKEDPAKVVEKAGSAEVYKFVLKKRTPESRLGRIENITIDGAQGTARGTSLMSGHADRPLRNVSISNLRVKMLPENKPDQRTTHAMVIERVQGLALRNVEVDWEEQSAEPGWGSALVLRDVDGLILDRFRGRAGRREGDVPAIRKERVSEAQGN